MAKENKDVFAEATTKFEEAQHKMLVEATQEKLTDLFSQASLIKKEIASLNKEATELDKQVETLKTKGIEAI